MLTVTKALLPDKQVYLQLLDEAWNSGYITNNGQLVLRLEAELKNYLDTKQLWYAANGTLVIQMAIKALNLLPGDEIITTPYSYVATSHMIQWENCRPVFADLSTGGFTISPDSIIAKITNKTKAILATHVYGLPCDVNAIDQIAKQFNLSVIYDGAHAFGSNLHGKSLLSFGDMSTCSFHATKIFHTVEGGCIIAKDEVVSRKLELYRQFGHIGDSYLSLGINAKSSEFHAAMGLALLPQMQAVIQERKLLFQNYSTLLQTTGLEMLDPLAFKSLEWNYAYFPVFFENEAQCIRIMNKLQEHQILPRRYFYPSLNTLPFYGAYQPCPRSENIASRVLCLPFFNGLTAMQQQQVVSVLVKHL